MNRHATRITRDSETYQMSESVARNIPHHEPDKKSGQQDYGITAQGWLGPKRNMRLASNDEEDSGAARFLLS